MCKKVKTLYRICLAKMLQHSPISCRFSEITVLSIGNTPPYLVLKSASENHNYFYFKPSSFSYSHFNVFMKLQQVTLILNVFYWLSKLLQNIEKLTTLQRIYLKKQYENFSFFYLLSPNL